jgi:glutamate-1-semialdehyde 2,1-aminomutase
LDFDHDERGALGTLFTVRMLERGVLAGTRFYPTLAHRDEHVDRFLRAVDQVFDELAVAIERRDIPGRLKTPVRQSGFQRLN